MALLSGNESDQEGTGKKASIYFDMSKCEIVQIVPVVAKHSFAVTAFSFIPLAVHQKDFYFSL
jgi:hypothetical protein